MTHVAKIERSECEPGVRTVSKLAVMAFAKIHRLPSEPLPFAFQRMRDLAQRQLLSITMSSP